MAVMSRSDVSCTLCTIGHLLAIPLVDVAGVGDLFLRTLVLSCRRCLERRQSSPRYFTVPSRVRLTTLRVDSGGSGSIGRTRNVRVL